MGKHFDLRELGFPKRFLGITITKCNDGSIFISQESYIENILKILEFTDSNTALTPMVPIANHRESRKSVPVQLNVPYRSAVGYLQYLVTCTRPDLAFAVGYVARFQNNPQPIHWKLVTRILKYLKGTKTLGFLFETSDKHQDLDPLDAYARMLISQRKLVVALQHWLCHSNVWPTGNMVL